MTISWASTRETGEYSGNEKAPNPGCFPRSGAFPSVRGGGLEPPPTIRGLAPQASASAYSATRAGDLLFRLSPRATDKTLARVSGG